MSADLLFSIAAEARAAGAPMVYDPILDRDVHAGSFNAGSELEASDVSAAKATTKKAPKKKDSFCVDHADLIAKYGEPVAFGPKGGLKWNEVVFAAKFAKVTQMLFSPEENRFYVYQPATGLWELESEAALRIQVFQDMRAFANAEGVEDLLFDIGDRGLRNVASILRGIAEQRNAFDTTHGRIHVANGMLDLSTGTAELKPFSAADRSRNRTPIDFDPAATCPRFLGELLVPALSAADIDLLQRWAGSLLLGKNHAQRVMILTGLAGGGKSTLVSVIESIIGLRNIAALRVDLLGERFEMSRYLGMLLLVGKDVRSDFLTHKSVSHVKSLTGGDRMTVELKGSNEVVPMRGDFGMVITSNADLRLTLDDDADAWRRRLLIVPFAGKKPAKPIPDFAGVLVREEGSGILRWMVEGAMKHLAELKSHGGYVLSADQQARIHAMLAESNSVVEFVSGCVVADKIRDVTTEELLSEYEAYCSRQDWAPVSAKSFRERIKQQMIEKLGVKQSHDIERYGSHLRGYRGVTVAKAPTATPAAPIQAPADGWKPRHGRNSAPLRWTPKIGQEGSLSPNPTENDPHVQETTSA